MFSAQLHSQPMDSAADGLDASGAGYSPVANAGGAGESGDEDDGVYDNIDIPLSMPGSMVVSPVANEDDDEQDVFDVDEASEDGGGGAPLSMPAASTAPGTCRGVLERREGVRKKFAKYEAMLEDSVLMLSRDRRKPVLTVETRGLELTREPPAKGKRAVAFTLRGGSREQQPQTFRVSDETEYARWVAALAQGGTRVASPVRPEMREDRTSTLPSRKASVVSPDVSVRYSAPPDTLAGSESMEDLAATAGSGELSPQNANAAPSIGYVRKKMNRFLRARPKKQELVSKGIIEMPVFGGTIEAIVKREAGRSPVANVPAVVCKVRARWGREGVGG